MPIEMSGLDRVPAHRRAAVFPDARPVRVVLVHAAARPDADDAAGDGGRRSERRHRSSRCRRCWSASTGRTCSTAARARCSSARRCAPFLAAAALVRVEVARDPAGALHRLGAAPAAARRRRSSPSSRSSTPTDWTESYFVPLSLLAGEAAERALKTTPGRRARARSPARARAPSSTACSTTTPATGCWRSSSSAAEIADLARHRRGRRRVRRSPDGRAARTAGAAPLGARHRRPEQQRRVRRRSLRAEAVPPHRAGAESGIRDRPVPHRARLHADAGARRRAAIPAARASSPARSPSCRRLVKHQGSGWEFTIDELRRYYERDRAARHAASEGPAVRRRRAARSTARRRSSRRSSTGISPSAATLGRRTAELHRGAGVGRGPGVRAGAARSRRAWRARRRHARARRRVARPARAAARHAERGVAGARGRGAVAPRGAAVAVRRDPRRSTTPGLRIRIHGDYHLGPGAAHRGGLRHPRLRGRAGAVDRGAARQAVAAQGRRRDDALVQLRGVRGAVRVHRARARRLRAARAVGRHVAALGGRRVPRRATRRRSNGAPLLPRADAVRRTLLSSVHARQGAVRAGVRAEQPARLGAHSADRASASSSASADALADRGDALADLRTGDRIVSRHP